MAVRIQAYETLPALEEAVNALDHYIIKVDIVTFPGERLGGVIFYDEPAVAAPVEETEEA